MLLTQLRTINPMVAVAAGALNKHTFNKAAPRWRIGGSGLNVEGVCTTPSCPAFKEMVIDRKVGYCHLACC